MVEIILSSLSPVRHANENHRYDRWRSAARIKNEDTEGIVAVRERLVEVANPGKFKSGQVAEKIEKRIGRPFSVSYHTRAWKYYEVRAAGNQASKL